ncbi:VRR-NUC domain-containing protein [uncultured Bacteroides sp.]|uniref:VRR-NUC domain-containing protein n=1 Tax=uncultured Bacteroides sp. TaxID=162156 RepID=UPI002612DFBE|nr:VRR-NUC domain-containing protein [uncultured Bacteroides sp.]
MTYDEMIGKAHPARTRKHPFDREHRLQCSCVRWFKLQYPQYAHSLFAVPNGSKRDAVTAARLKEEGVLAGVSDLILLKSNRFYGALLIEMKTDKGRQSPAQKEWEARITADGYKYVIVRSLEEFIKVIKEYLSDL